jgi:hypothetical protein
LYVISSKHLEHSRTLLGKVAVGLLLESKQEKRCLGAKLHGI